MAASVKIFLKESYCNLLIGLFYNSSPYLIGHQNKADFEGARFY